MSATAMPAIINDICATTSPHELMTSVAVADTVFIAHARDIGRHQPRPGPLAPGAGHLQ